MICAKELHRLTGHLIETFGPCSLALLYGIKALRQNASESVVCHELPPSSNLAFPTENSCALREVYHYVRRAIRSVHSGQSASLAFQIALSVMLDFA
jgi:hypothetical protein